MNIEIINGQFDPKDALSLITQMIHVKIKFHEGKILDNEVEEDILMRETKIKKLQKLLFETNKYLSSSPEEVNIQSTIHLKKHNYV